MSQAAGLRYLTKEHTVSENHDARTYADLMRARAYLESGWQPYHLAVSIGPEGDELECSPHSLDARRYNVIGALARATGGDAERMMYATSAVQVANEACCLAARGAGSQRVSMALIGKAMQLVAVCRLGEGGPDLEQEVRDLVPQLMAQVGPHSLLARVFGD